MSPAHPIQQQPIPLIQPYHDIHIERLRAHNKHAPQGASREDADWINVEWLPILVEEIGEVAHLLTYDHNLQSQIEQRSALREELVQVAAMATAWIASIDDDTRYGRRPTYITLDQNGEIAPLNESPSDLPTNS